MALPIITALRQRRDLKESLLHTAQELAHRASIYGVISESNTYMAQKCHCSKRTFQRHVVQLVDTHKILRKRVIKKVVKVQVGDHYERRLRNETNIYTFLLPWQHPDRTQAPIDTMATNLPYPQDKEKHGSLVEEMKTLEKGLRFCTPGSEAYVTTLAKIEQQKALLPRGHAGRTP